MSMMSGFGFSGIDPLGTIFESGNNYFWNSAAADDAYSRSLSAADYAYALHQKSLLESPAAMVKGLEAAGLNPILAANSSAGSFSSSVPALTQQGDGGHGGVSSAGDPLTIARTRASIAQAKSAADAQRSLTKVYDAQAERLRYMPLTESDNGGLSIFGTGFNAGGTDTLLYDTKTGSVIRPKSNGAGGTSSSSETFSAPSSSARSYSSGVEEALKKKGFTWKDLKYVE